MPAPDILDLNRRSLTGSLAMADTNVNAPFNRTGTAPKAGPDNRRSAEDEATDAALDAALGKDLDEANVSFKRQWDAGLQAELDAALADFDEASFNPPSPRSGKPAGARKGDNERGHEGRPGTRTGKVIGLRGKVIFIDMGGKSEGILPVTDFEEGQLPAPGSSIEVVVERFDPEEGVQILRLKGAAIDADWSNLKKGVTVEARVTKTCKGGLEVDVDGIRGFLPISQIDLSRVDDAATYVNQKFKAIVTEANQREKNLVISRRELMEQERAEQREKTWATLEEGQIRDGIVRSIKDFGAFVDLGGVDGLLPIGEMSWSRVSKVDEMVKIGDQVKVKVLKLDPVAQAHARPEAAHAQSLAGRDREISARHDGQGKGVEDHGLRRLRRARAGHRRLDPHFRAVAHAGAQGRRYRQAGPGGRGPHPQGRTRGQAYRPVVIARQEGDSDGR